MNVVNGFGVEAGKPLASSPAHRKVAFTGETTTGRLIMQYASENLIPVTLELGGKSPNIFFADVMDEDDDFFDKALEGFAMFALNQGEVCTVPVTALWLQESIYDAFIERAVKRVEQIKQGNPLDPTTMIGAQASNDQFEKILSYIDIGKKEGAKLLTGGERAHLGGELEDGYYVQPTVFEGHNKMRIFQEEIFGPVVVGDQVQGRGRSAAHRQRHALWPGCRRLDARHQHCLPDGSWHPGRTRLDQLLPPLSRRMRPSAATSSPVSAARTTR